MRYWDSLDWGMAAITGTLVVLIGLLLLGAVASVKSDLSERDDLEKRCNFIGSRIEKGFGAVTIYIYQCPEGRRETIYAPAAPKLGERD